ncbi:MAG TPA: hypothetical protein VKU00_13695 [Chthonomonadaceae bacterium]|nr:hypothetical protein [Chthonomonadaceae bacterium]
MRLLPDARHSRACTRFVTACLSLFTLFAYPHSALAELRIDTETPHAATWRKIYEQLPDAWKSSRIVVVREVSDAEMERLVAQTEGGSNNRSDDGSVVDGVFQPGEKEEDPDTITLRESLRGSEVDMVFTHEYGHFVWDIRMTRAQRDQYRRIWKVQKHQGSLVTRYAGDSPEEGFAEAFAYFLRKSSVLKRRDADSWNFLNGLLPEKQRTP